MTLGSALLVEPPQPWQGHRWLWGIVLAACLIGFSAVAIFRKASTLEGEAVPWGIVFLLAFAGTAGYLNLLRQLSTRISETGVHFKAGKMEKFIPWHGSTASIVNNHILVLKNGSETVTINSFLFPSSKKFFEFCQIKLQK